MKKLEGVGMLTAGALTGAEGGHDECKGQTHVSQSGSGLALPPACGFELQKVISLRNHRGLGLILDLVIKGLVGCISFWRELCQEKAFVR